MSDSFTMETWPLGPLETNCYILWKKSGESVVVDPADDGAGIQDFIKSRGLTLKAILLTHGHFDHIGGLPELASSSLAPVWIHEGDDAMLRDPGKNMSVFMENPIQFRQGVHHLTHDQQLDFGFEIKVLWTPGHSPGSVSFLVGDAVLAGDTLFYGSVGRTDLPGSSTETMMNSIRNQLMTLDDAVRVCPGHGPATTIGRERRENPFLEGSQFQI